MNKNFTFEKRQFAISDPNNETFRTAFHQTAYKLLFDRITDGRCEPHIDTDQLVQQVTGIDLYDLAKQHNLKPDKLSPKSDIRPKERDEVKKALQLFLGDYPLFVSFVQNCNLKADIAITHAEALIDKECDIQNFMRLKRIINHFNSRCWSRLQSVSESNSSKNSLGNISENLLEKAFGALVDGKNLIKINNDEVQSYGDFVLVSLPNNLWLSVKSNFSRERLLASGYSNDILGVGFFEDFKEFTTRTKLRNMMKAVFLCLYLPDIPVTEKQIKNGENTFQQTVDHYRSSNPPVPLNINGGEFLRPLSKLADHLKPLLEERDISKRLTLNF